MAKNTTDSLDTLEVLNIMASYIGIPPLINLTDIADYPDFLYAQQVLEDVARSVLSQGLPCNVDYNLELTTFDISGNLEVPAGALICDPIRDGYVERDGLIYDLHTNTNVTTTGVKADITWNWIFDDLPILVKQYISIVASRAFVSRIKGDEAGNALSIPDERRIKLEFQRYSFNMGDVSTLYGEVPYLIARAGRNIFGYTNRY